MVKRSLLSLRRKYKRSMLLIVFTMWVRSPRQEVAICLSLGIGKVKILGQFVLEAVIVAALALAVALPVSVPVTEQRSVRVVRLFSNGSLGKF